MLTSLRKIGVRSRGPKLLRGMSKVVDYKVQKTGNEYVALKELHKERAGNRAAYSKKSRLLGEVFLKDSLRFNILTKKMMADMEDYLDWMEFDGFMRLVKLTSDDPEYFSAGTDMKLLLACIERGDVHAAADYLRKLQNFAMYVTGYNKPLILELEGDIHNSAAAMFLQMPIVNCVKPARAIFDEMHRGSTLLAGTSYVMSRLPLGVGKFIVLTGTPIEGSDLLHLGFVDKRLFLDSSTMQIIEDKFVHLPRFREVSLIGNLPQMLELRDSLTRSEFQSTYMNFLIKDEIEKGHPNPHALLKDLVARDTVTRHANQLDNETSRWQQRLDSINQTGILKTIENRLGTVEEYILKMVDQTQGMGNTGQDTALGPILSSLNFIQRAFNEDNIAAIRANLREINSPWTLKVLRDLEQVDDDLANIMLGQIDFAAEHDYVSSLLKEYEVAMERIATLAGLDFSKFNLELVPRSPIKSLLPIKEYYRDFPDAVRMALNNTKNTDPFVHKNFGETFRTFLNLRGIDTLNPVVNCDVIREVLWRRKKNLMDIEKDKEVRSLLLNNPDLKNKYVNSRKAAIETLFSKPNLGEELDRKVANAFNNKLLSNKKLMFERSRSIQPIARKERVRQLRQTVMNKALTPNVVDTFKKNINLGADLPLEIGSNPHKMSREIKVKYSLNSRAKFFAKKRNLDPLKLQSYFLGNITKEQLYDVELAMFEENDPALADKHLITADVVSQTTEYGQPLKEAPTNLKAVVEVIEQDYFGDYDLPAQRSNELAIQHKFRLFQQFFDGQDEREKQFREQYVEDILHKVEELRGAQLSAEEKEVLSSRVIDTYFDYVKGNQDPTRRSDPHLARKSVAMSLVDILNLHKNSINKQVISPYEKDALEWMADLERVSFSKVGALNESMVLRSERAHFVPALINMATCFLTTSEEYKHLVGKLAAGPSNNSLITRINEIFYKQLMAGFVKTVMELPTGAEKSYIPLLDGLTNGGKPEDFMKSIDYYLIKNIEFDFLQFTLPSALFHFSYDVLEEFDKLYSNMTVSEPLENSSESSSTIEERRQKIVDYLKSKLFLREVNNNELAQAVEYLDSIMFDMAEINIKEKKNIHLKKDRVLAYGNKNSSLYMKERDETSEGNPEDPSLAANQIDTLRSHPHKLAAKLYKSITAQNKKKAHRSSLSTILREQLEDAKSALNIKPNPTANIDGAEELSNLYREKRMNNLGGKRLFVPGSACLIFELEGLIKKMNEGLLSGVDDDFSEIKNVLKETVITNRQSAEDWLDQRLTEYFEMLFRIREKYEAGISQPDLIALDLEFAQFFKPDRVQAMLLDEVEKDKAAFDFLQNLERAEDSKEVDVGKFNKNPMLMAFTMRHRIVNSAAFKQYRTLYFIMQSKKAEYQNLTIKQKRARSAEMDILKIHLERLFQESQKPNVDVVSRIDRKMMKEARKTDDVERDDFESELRLYSAQLAKNVAGISKSQVFEQKVTEELDTLMARFKIYGI